MKNTQNIRHQDSSNPVRSEAVITAKEFKDFKVFLSLIKSNFNDFSLVDGAFRARSNNDKCIVETGFGFFSDMRFDITNIKKFVRIISKFDKTNSITVTLNNGSIIFEDSVGPIELSRGNLADLKNKFISDKEMVETVLSNVDPTKLIVSEAIPKIIVSRIFKAAPNLFSRCIHLKHDKNDLNKGFLLILGGSGDTEFRTELQKPFLIPMKKNHFFNLLVTPTIFNRDDMYLKCYFTNDQKIFMIYSTKVNDLFVNIYSKSELIEESVEI